jgi:hypothetical protein
MAAARRDVLGVDQVNVGKLHVDQIDASDPAAREAVRELFETHRERVFYSRQIEVLFEDRFFHWVTNRAVRALTSEGVIVADDRVVPSTNGAITLLWHRSYRYPRRAAAATLALVDEYSNPNIGAALGLQGEAHVLEGFASRGFVMRGRESREFDGVEWRTTQHDLDFIFERDAVVYGVEVKNRLGYMAEAELDVKLAMCAHLRIVPVFVARMLPRTWINRVQRAGGFALILKWQLYPWAHKDLAKRVHAQLELPVDAPTRLEAGTMQRFVAWHERHVEGFRV